MLLVQQPHHPSTLSPMSTLKHVSPLHHRRNPSAPAVVHVQPTKTPGIFALAPRSPPQPRHATPRQYRTPKAQHSSQSPEIEKEKPRGRGQVGKDGASKPSSHPSKSRAGQHGSRARQPSPSPLSSSEQTSTDNLSSIPPFKSISTPVAPAVASNGASGITLSAPSGRLAAKRRNRASVAIPPSASVPSVLPVKQPNRSQTPPAKTKAIAVPVKAKPKTNTLPISSSDPSIGHMPRTRVRRGVADIFPICDDVDDDHERPSTPTPRNGNDRAFDERGPLTAPVGAEAPYYFPSSSPPRPEHRRAPSVPAESSFSSTFDSDTELNRSETSALFGRQRPRLNDSVRSLSTPIKKPGVSLTFASSMFQNSPSPEHLPPPTFSLASMKKGKVIQD